MIYTKENVIAGIVTYNPEIERLSECIAAVIDQVDQVVIIDNGSDNVYEIEGLISAKIKLIEWKKNKGIAAALKEIMEFASSYKYAWVLTIDQDSITQRGLVKEYLEFANNDMYSNVGMYTCLIKDRNFYDRKHEVQKEDIKAVSECITSAAFCNVEKYNTIDGYDETFFIDCVDFDICYQLRDAGYEVCCINYLGLLHEVGHGENRKFLLWDIVVYHHNVKRVYTLSRNMVWLWKKHHRLYGRIKLIKKQIALLVRIIFFENEKYAKIRAFITGTKKGYSQRVR